MGREVRRVPPNWNHPKVGECIADPSSPYHERAYELLHSGSTWVTDDSYITIYDSNFDDVAREWIKGFLAWHSSPNPVPYWEQDCNPPDRAMYRTYQDSEATWYQLYETVSEGTPVTPPFATTGELVEYLSTRGDFWQQNDVKRGEPIRTYSRESAEAMVKIGSCFSFVVTVKDGMATIMSGADDLVSIPEP